MFLLLDGIAQTGRVQTTAGKRQVAIRSSVKTKEPTTNDRFVEQRIDNNEICFRFFGRRAHKKLNSVVEEWSSVTVVFKIAHGSSQYSELLFKNFEYFEQSVKVVIGTWVGISGISSTFYKKIESYGGIFGSPRYSSGDLRKLYLNSKHFFSVRKSYSSTCRNLLPLRL